MYVKVNDVFKLASAWIKESAVSWRRVDGLVKIDGAWRGWFRKSGSIGVVSDYDWDDYSDAGSWVYLWQYRYVSAPAFASPIRFVSGTLSAAIENRDDYDSTYDIRIEGLVNGVWTLLGSSPTVVIPHNSWQTVVLDISREAIEITQVRYGVGTKHFFADVNGSVTGWEEFGTYTG